MAVFAADEFERDRLRSISPTEREDFFQEKAELLSWFTRWERVLDTTEEPRVKWFCGGTLNLCYNSLDRHVQAGHGDRTALIYDSPRTGQVVRYSYNQLLEQTLLVAGVLRDNCGVSKGDYVVIFMPKLVETAVALLACARLGAVATVVYGGMLAYELCRRIDHCRAKAVVSASGGLVRGQVFDFKTELDLALRDCAHLPNRCLILLREGLGCQDLCPGRDISWSQAVSSARPCLECVPVEANEPLYLFYTSGTTGEPKGILLPNCYCLSFLYCPSYYLRLPESRQGHVYFTTSEFGWILAQYYMVVKPLITCQSAVIFEGDQCANGTSSNFPRLVAQHGITFVVSCSAPFREMKQNDPECTFREKYDCSSLSMVLLGGECSDEELLKWVSEAYSCIATDAYGQTEIMQVTGCVWPYATFGSAQFFTSSWTTIGLDLAILNEGGKVADVGTVGRVCFRPPLRPGSLLTIFKNDEYFEKEYFQTYSGFYDTKDRGQILENGQLKLYGRDDDVIIMDGIRFHGNSLEQELRQLDMVRDCAVVSGPNPIHWEEPVAFVIFNNGQTPDWTLINSVRNTLCNRLFLRTFSIVPVTQLPMTRSGKVSRKTLKDLLTRNGLQKISLTFCNPDSVQQIHLMIDKLRKEQKMPAILL